MHDLSNGYDAISKLYLQARGSIGTAVVRAWAESFPREATVMDMGCGTGIPVTKILLEAGLKVYAVDASPNMVAMVRTHFPEVHVAVEAAEQSVFFNRSFDGIIAIGLIFLLAEESQQVLISKMGKALLPGGKLLFTAPLEKVEWTDVMTGNLSRSLGAEAYRKLMLDAGLPDVEEFEDEGGNHYFSGARSTT